MAEDLQNTKRTRQILLGLPDTFVSRTNETVLLCTILDDAVCDRLLGLWAH